MRALVWEAGVPRQPLKAPFPPNCDIHSTICNVRSPTSTPAVRSGFAGGYLPSPHRDASTPEIGRAGTRASRRAGTGQRERRAISSIVDSSRSISAARPTATQGAVGRAPPWRPGGALSRLEPGQVAHREHRHDLAGEMALIIVILALRRLARLRQAWRLSLGRISAIMKR